jgi:hypothetical protein
VATPFTVTVAGVGPGEGKSVKCTVMVVQLIEIVASLAPAGPAINTSTPANISTTPAMAATTLALALRTTPPFIVVCTH